MVWTSVQNASVKGRNLRTIRGGMHTVSLYESHYASTFPITDIVTQELNSYPIFSEDWGADEYITTFLLQQVAY